MRKTLIQTLLAAFCAIPFALRSLGEGWVAHTSLEGGGVMLINMRNAMLSGGKRTPTARDYVQDGLIAMWDGVENAGWGVHDSEADTWINLAPSGFDLAVDLTQASWLDNHIKVTGMTCTSDQTLSNVQTIEMVMRDLYQAYSYAGQHGSRFLSGKSGVAFIWFMHAPGIFPGPISVSSNDAAGSERKTIASRSYSRTRHYVNGVSLSIYRPPLSGLAPINPGTYAENIAPSPGLELYTVRYYSRVLTSDEIAANYAIDKARFNLPDAT